jgi:HD-GYP domain-containing protein (c-di-GMP phosphodiesterase class II)
VLEAPDELVTYVTEHGSRVEAKVLARGPAWVEIGLGFGGVVFAWPPVLADERQLETHLRRSRGGYTPLVLLGDERQLPGGEEATGLRARGEISLEPLPLGEGRVALLLTHLREALALRRAAAERELVAERLSHEIDQMTAIGRALSSERNIDRLLALILEKTRAVTDADAGSVYVVEGEDEDVEKRVLHFKVAQNDSRPMDFVDQRLPVSPRSIVGSCVLSRSVINIPDLYRLEEFNRWGFFHNRAFDERLGYQTRSMLTVPMIDNAGQVIGVIQLINRKRRPEALLLSPEDFDFNVRPFDERTEGLAATLASQAGIALENALLYDDIRQLFEGFVTASVTAIEQRDPTTSGHSQRVADLTVELARVTSRVERGPYHGFSASRDELKQIEYAALLHDFGKVGVRENVLVKAKKLYENERELILSRFDLIRRDLEADAERRKVHALLGRPRDEALAALELIDDELAARLAELEGYTDLVMRANEPTILEEGGFERLGEIASRTYTHPVAGGRGEKRPYLTSREVEALQILRGSLTMKERIEIESHVTHTYNFLRRIPWGRALRNVPEYAGSHHEKLDGSGYPRRLRAEEIPPAARMMTISDIYDALTASDRPYKRAVPIDKALDIIGAEVKHGKCDAELFRIFVEARVWHVVHRA